MIPTAQAFNLTGKTFNNVPGPVDTSSLTANLSFRLQIPPIDFKKDLTPTSTSQLPLENFPSMQISVNPPLLGDFNPASQNPQAINDDSINFKKLLL